jgi:hypothetical protein
VEDRDGEAARELIRASSDTVGAAVGGALGLVGSPIGAVGGAAGGVVVARVLRHAALEIRERVLAPRQTVRVADTYTLAADAISARLMRGDPLREDGFLDEDRDLRGRSPAEELLEGVLLRASTEFEERKLKHLAWFYAALPFDTVGPEEANYLLRLAGDLTYGQLVGLALLNSATYEHVKREAGTASRNRTVPGTEPARAELASLVQAGLLAVPDADGSASAVDITDPSNMNPGRLSVRTPGGHLYRLMRLDGIPTTELESLVARLGWTADV